MIAELRTKSISKTSPVPLYFQLQEILRDFIREQPADAPLPSEAELCGHFGISRPTVRQAISELSREGYVYRSKGRGTFVSRNKFERNFVSWRDGFNEDVINKGHVPETKVLRLESAYVDDAVASHLALKANASVIFLRRLRFVDGEPVLVVNSYLPAARLPGFSEKDFAARALHSILAEDYSMRLQRTRRVLEAIGAPHPEAELLNIRIGVPVQYFENTVFLDDDSIIEFSEGWYRGDRVRFTFEYEKKNL